MKMKSKDAAHVLRSIPSIDDLLQSAELAGLRSAHPHFPWTRFVRACVDDVRARILEDTTFDAAMSPPSQVAGIIAARFAALKEPGMKRVINGTGVILHTNLGRAVQGETVQDAIRGMLGSYVNLEFDLERGERGKRGEQMHRLIQLATGAEATMVVNNNAAAVYLIANTFSPPGRVLISRGELVEIGGSFRLPTILGRAAAEVIEVGTTNRTFAQDYAKVARPNDVIMKVHRSNYEIEGFAHEASLDELIACAKEAQCMCVCDLGSGALFDFASAGMPGEEQVERVIETGVDCVTMSGDKLLGGVQAGIIAGTAQFIRMLKENPLSRAVRIDKIGIAAVESLFRTYIFSAKPAADIPILAQTLESMEALRRRAAAVAEVIGGRIPDTFSVAVADDDAAVGGGSFARSSIPGVAVVVVCPSEKTAVALARSMRMNAVPLIARIRGNELRFNMRSVLPRDDADLGAHAAMLIGAFGASSGGAAGDPARTNGR
ncbi:MAG: L-seryl-tRNA(Sec) selenium transferase [Chitinivibrionia bacterium]|nr:L-seryl-tRNA(Sec) selenium transferase [Chitinivibrionia bacterium]